MIRKELENHKYITHKRNVLLHDDIKESPYLFRLCGPVQRSKGNLINLGVRLTLREKRDTRIEKRVWTMRLQCLFKELINLGRLVRLNLITGGSTLIHREERANSVRFPRGFGEPALNLGDTLGFEGFSSCKNHAIACFNEPSSSGQNSEKMKTKKEATDVCIIMNIIPPDPSM